MYTDLLTYMYSQGRITSELVGIGAQCRGERHDQIIMRQREALAELRARVKTLEQARPPCEWGVFFWWGVGGGWGWVGCGELLMVYMPGEGA